MRSRGVCVSYALRLLRDACRSFTRHGVVGIQANRARIAQLVESSLMLVTALSPHIGYDKAAQVAHKAHVQNKTLRQAASSSASSTEKRSIASCVPRR